MEDFLLLGQIPGTTITITFGTWLLILAWAIVIVLAIRALLARKRLERVVTGAIIGFSMRRLLR